MFEKIKSFFGFGKKPQTFVVLEQPPLVDIDKLVEPVEDIPVVEQPKEVVAPTAPVKKTRKPRKPRAKPAVAATPAPAVKKQPQPPRKPAAKKK